MKPYYETKLGKLYHGNCSEVMSELEPVDLIITDPPYGVNFKKAEWDKEIPKVALELPSMFKACAIIVGITNIWQYPPARWIACWARPASSSRSKVGGFSHWSPVLLYGNCKLKVDFMSAHAIAHAYPKGFPHPSPKPLILMKWLIHGLSIDSMTILDPFLGSGTTAVACEHFNRKWIGIEKEEKYCEIAAQRIENETKQLKLFR